MKTKISLLILLLLSPLTGAALHSQPLLQRLSAEHGPFWSEAFGTDDWRTSDIGFVVVKHTGMLYVVRQDARHDTIARFPVCAMDTSPGFKERQGDGRTPDGIYRIPLLNPGSSYHLSMKMNYPNAVDDARHARHTRLAGGSWPQGGDIFIHGKCASIGCIAMTDDGIEKLYVLVASLPASRRQIPVLVLPYDNESHYEQMYVHADRQYRADGDPYWLLLRDHIDNMRAVWRFYRDTGRIPDAVPMTDGLYAIPANGK
ncbi:MAG: L,D-transpeptidase family protein [Bacteroidetes bacterium]|nr:L,D-transpeptidase family protein [Bacteroidota bacterium]